MVVGRDMRPHSPSLAGALIDGIRSTGMKVIDIGMVDTSMIYFAINHLDAVGGIMTTASHNPINYNGFKISGPKAKPIGSCQRPGRHQAHRLNSCGLDRPASREPSSSKIFGTPTGSTCSNSSRFKRKLRVAIDASNGMAGKMVPAVFGKVPNLEIVPLLFEITGTSSTSPTRWSIPISTCSRPKLPRPKPDFGVCFDGDADRCLFVDEQAASTIGCDMITALLARDFLKVPENKGATIVYDLRSSHVVADEVKAAGGEPRRERVGHAFIKKTMAETKAVFGGELSGHFYFRDNFFADSGAIAFARLCSVMSAQSQPLSSLIAPLIRYSQSGEMNFQVEDKEGKIRELADAYKKAQIDYLDGITIDLGDWWFNVRKSNTEPLLRLNLEARARDDDGREIDRDEKESGRAGAWALR